MPDLPTRPVGPWMGWSDQLGMGGTTANRRRKRSGANGVELGCVTGSVGAMTELLERALVVREAPAGVHGLGRSDSLGRAALREHVLDPGPARAGRAHVGASARARGAGDRGGARRVDAGERRSIERRVALRAERRDAERDRNDAARARRRSARTRRCRRRSRPAGRPSGRA